MINAWEPFRSVGPIWCVWLASTTLTALMTAAALRRGRARLSPARLARDEGGAAYTLSYVMVFPLYALMIGLVIETTLILVTKAGATYAAYCGARAAIVHWPGDTRGQAGRAATVAFIPFAGTAKELRSPGNGGVSDPGAARFAAAYTAYGGRPVSGRYLGAKYRSATTSLGVTVAERPAGLQADLTVAVDYPFPFHIPGVGRLLGTKGGDGLYVYPVVSRVTLRSEAPENEEHALGISYASAP